MSKRLRTGDVFFAYLIWYPVGRFWVELFRPDAWRMGSLATAQWIAIGAFKGEGELTSATTIRVVIRWIRCAGC